MRFRRRPAKHTAEPIEAPTYNACMIYRCDHRWSDIPDPGGYVGEECLRCGVTWGFELCAHEPSQQGCRCAR